MGLVDALINGRSYDEARDYLREAGVDEAELPSDHSIRTFLESVEYRSARQQRQTACHLAFTAGSVTGCAASRVEILQNNVLVQMESWAESGLLELADLYKIANFTLQFQRNQVMARRTAHQMGIRPVPESLGTRDIPAAELDAYVQQAAERVEAERQAQEAAAAAADEAEAVAMAATGEEEEEDGGTLRNVEDNGGFLRNLEERGGSLRMIEDAADDEDDADDDDEAAEPMLAAVGATCATAQSGHRPAARPLFKNSPSPSTRAKARKRRKKR
jgi:hypothetical protein